MNYPVAYHLRQKQAKLRFYLERVAYATVASRPLTVSGSPSFNRDFLTAINDACEYLGIGLSGFMEMMEDHAQWPQQLWEQVAGNVEEYNKNITGDIGRKNICANTMCSFGLKYTHDTLYAVLQMLNKDRNGGVRLCDYGCGNANVSFSMLLGGMASMLRMCDLHSESADFIKYRIQKYGLGDRAVWQSVDDSYGGELFDVVYCIDVLEHTETPSSILETRIAPLLKKGGYLIVQAPWGGGVVSHLDEAIVDFYSRGGREYLEKHFTRFYTMSTLDISGVWVKR